MRKFLIRKPHAAQALALRGNTGKKQSLGEGEKAGLGIVSYGKIDHYYWMW